MSELNAFSKYENEVKIITSSGFDFSAMIDMLGKLVNDIASEQISKLNSLLAKFKLPFLAGEDDGILARIAKNLLTSQINKINTLVDNTLTNLVNAGISYAENIVKEFASEVISYVFISDELNAKAIRVMVEELDANYKYNNNYLRMQSLTRDWNYTLEYVDELAGVNYESTYNNLDRDLDFMSTNGCKLNIAYAFGKMYSHYKILNTEYNKNVSQLSQLEEMSESYEKQLSICENMNKYLTAYRELFVKHTKQLIVYSYDNVDIDENIASLFNDYGDIIKPKYFGENDDLYSNKYTITEKDMNIMLPYFNEIDNSGDSNIAQVSVTSDVLNLFSQDYSIDGILENGVTKVQSKVNGIANSKFDIQYNSGNKIELETNKYTLPRNSHIKSIYVYLSNSTIHGNDAMINYSFYRRCKLSYMTTFNEFKEKVMVSLPTKVDTRTSAEKLIYDYLIKSDRFLFDPSRHSKNMNIFSNTLGILSPLSSDSGNSTNKETEEIITDNMNKESSTVINSVVKYNDYIDMVNKKNFLLDLFEYFYKRLESMEYSESRITGLFENATKGIFNRSLSTYSELNKVLNTYSDYNLNVAINYVISITLTDSIESILGTTDKNIVNSFKTLAYMFILKVSVYGFTGSLYKNDKIQLTSYDKKTYQSFRELLKKINDVEHDLHGIFYNLKDIMTMVFKNYDNSGIKFSTSIKNFESTNINIGDYNNISRTTDGLFVTGNNKHHSGGIFKILTNNEVVETNISEGNWLRIIECMGYTFFTNDDNDVYCYHKKEDIIIYTGLTCNNGNDLIFASVNNIIFVTSSSDNMGIRMFNSGTYTLDECGVNTGINFIFKYDSINSKLYTFSKDSPGVYLLTSYHFSVLAGTDETTYNGMITFTETVVTTITTTIPPDPDAPVADGEQPSSTTVTETVETPNYWCVFIGSGNIKMVRTVETVITEYLSSLGNNRFTLIENNNGYFVVDSTNNRFGMLKYYDRSSSYSREDDVLYMDNVENFDYIKVYGTSYNKTLFNIRMNIGDDVVLGALFNNDIEINTLSGITSSEIVDSIHVDNEKGKYTLLHGPNIEGVKTLYDIEKTFNTVTHNNDNITKNNKWIIDYVNGEHYFNVPEDVNITVFGIKILSVTRTDSKFKDINLTGKKWKIVYMNSKLYALSTNGNNKGIFYASSPTVFDITNVKYNDFINGYYDKEYKTSYILTNRSNTLFDYKNEKYDIDEFIYYLDDLERRDLIRTLYSKICKFMNINFVTPGSIISSLDGNIMDAILGFVSGMASSAIGVSDTFLNSMLNDAIDNIFGNIGSGNGSSGGDNDGGSSGGDGGSSDGGNLGDYITNSGMLDTDLSGGHSMNNGLIGNLSQLIDFDIDDKKIIDFIIKNMISNNVIFTKYDLLLRLIEYNRICHFENLDNMEVRGEEYHDYINSLVSSDDNDDIVEEIIFPAGGSTTYSGYDIITIDGQLIVYANNGRPLNGVIRNSKTDETELFEEGIHKKGFKIGNGLMYRNGLLFTGSYDKYEYIKGEVVID